MKTSVTLETVTVPAYLTGQRCHCGRPAKTEGCGEYGVGARDETYQIEVGTVWERVTVSGTSATFSYQAGDTEEYDRKLRSALRRIVGYSVDVGWGHYGKYCSTGGLSVHGKYSTERI